MAPACASFPGLTPLYPAFALSQQIVNEVSGLPTESCPPEQLEKVLAVASKVFAEIKALHVFGQIKLGQAALHFPDVEEPLFLQLQKMRFREEVGGLTQDVLRRCKHILTRYPNDPKWLSLQEQWRVLLKEQGDGQKQIGARLNVQYEANATWKLWRELSSMEVQIQGECPRQNLVELFSRLLKLPSDIPNRPEEQYGIAQAWRLHELCEQLKVRLLQKLYIKRNEAIIERILSFRNAQTLDKAGDYEAEALQLYLKLAKELDQLQKFGTVTECRCVVRPDDEGIKTLQDAIEWADVAHEQLGELQRHLFAPNHFADPRVPKTEVLMESLKELHNRLESLSPLGTSNSHDDLSSSPQLVSKSPSPLGDID